MTIDVTLGRLRAGADAGGRLECVEYGSLTDERLLERVAAERDPDAFDELYRRYARAIHGLVQGILRDHGASQDTVQEAFASVWRSAAGYRQARGRAVAWLFAIARNAAVDAARARRPVAVGDPQDSIDPAPQPDARVARELEAFRVHVAVDRLPPRERDVIALAYFDDLSQSQISDRLGIPLGTVKTRTRAALRRLAAELAEER